ncbi:MAG: hypothetical protein HKN92_12470 [Chitinophagales bacterium]|nr:hypothetical protein [Chitinophagales bacterium]
MRLIPTTLAFCSFLFASLPIKAQQILPIKLITEPEKFSFALSGIFTGNLSNSDFTLDKSSKEASGQIYLDAVISEMFTGSVHINAISSKNYFDVDSLDLSALAFSQNSYTFDISLKAQHKNEQNIYSGFLDYAISTADFKTYQNWEEPELNQLIMHKLNIGFEYSWIADWDQDLVVNTSLKYNFIVLDFPFEKEKYLYRTFSLSPDEALLNRYSGLSMKTSIQLNNIAIFFETQNNFKLFNRSQRIPIEGFTRQTFYSIGFTTTSTAILAERRKAPKRKVGKGRTIHNRKIEPLRN